MNKVNLKEKYDQIQSFWDPKIVGALNGQEVKLAKFSGPFTWHSHELEDELFLVLEGSFLMEFRTHSVEVGEGEFLIVPKGTEHRPVAEREATVLLFEPASTLNTGDVRNEHTKQDPEWI